MDNLKIWERFADIDPKFTKPITGKPYKGTSPNPHYVIKCLTEMFGPVGQGFGWEVVAEGFQQMDEELLHWCRIRFWHGEGKGFDAYGQTKAVMKTRNGIMTDEDAPKKSLTDAITKAAAQIGVASNIFLGRWDDNKYVSEVDAKFREEERQGNPAPDPKPKPEMDQEARRDWIKAQIGKARHLEELERFWGRKDIAEAIKSLHPAMQGELQKAKDERAAAVFQAPAEAAE